MQIPKVQLTLNINKEHNKTQIKRNQIKNKKMNAIITINDANQDKSLRGTFDELIKENGWNSIPEVENSYIKNFESTEHHQVIKLVQKELDTVTYDTEWENLKLIVITTNTTYSIMTANES